MKLYRAYKKQFNLIFLAMLLIFPMVFLHAQTVQDINNKINQKNADIAKLEQEIAQYQNQLDDLGQQKNSLNRTLEQLDITRKKLIADISVTQNKIDKTNFQIQELSSQITNKEASIASDQEAIALGLRQTNESELNPFIDTLLSKNNFTEVWNDISDLASLRGKIRQQV